jgi:Putative transposase
MTLPTHEFIRRFLIHVLPKGLHRIRHYGLFANGNRSTNIARARELAMPPRVTKPEADPPWLPDKAIGEILNGLYIVVAVLIIFAGLIAVAHAQPLPWPNPLDEAQRSTHEWVQEQQRENFERQQQQRQFQHDWQQQQLVQDDEQDDED